MSINILIEERVEPQFTVLDIGCGDKGRSKNLNCKEVVTLDAWLNVNPDILLDLTTNNIPFDYNSFDIILMIDFIEHVEKERGEELIKQAKDIASKGIILLTPLWWTDNSQNVNNPDLWCYGNKYDYHKSLWTLEDFSDWKRVEGIPNLDNYFVGVYDILQSECI